MTAVATAATDARETAIRIREDLESRATRTAEAAPAAVADIYVGWFAAVDAAACPARYRADGVHGWSFPGWSPALASAAVGRAALGHHLHLLHRSVHSTGGGSAPRPDPGGAVRTWMQAAAGGESRPPVAEWITDRMVAKDRAALAATAAAASRWLGGFVRVLGWPLPEGLGIVSDDQDNPMAFRWQKRHRFDIPVRGTTARLTVAGSPDGVSGKVTAAGSHVLVVHRPSAPTDVGLVERAAYEAVAAAVSTGLVPAEVLFTLGDTGERTRLDIDAVLLERGVAMIDNVVRQRVAAQAAPETDAFMDATPSSACRFCDHRDLCEPGRSWLDDPTRRDGGLPTIR